MIETDLRIALLAAPAVSALVGQRVHEEVAPAGTPRPYITYQTINGARDVTLVSVSKTRNAQMQIDCYADTQVKASELAKRVLPAVAESPLFKSVFKSDQPMRDPETKLFRVMLEFSIWKTDE